MDPLYIGPHCIDLYIYPSYNKIVILVTNKCAALHCEIEATVFFILRVKASMLNL